MADAVHLKTQTIRGKYQIKKGIFAACYLDVIEADDHVFEAFIGTQHRADTVLPAGTKVYLNADAINKIKARRSHEFDEYCVSVQQVGDANGKPLHHCSPLVKTSHPEQRAHERKKTEFFIHLDGGKLAFVAHNGTIGGLKLAYKSRRAMLSLCQHQICDFDVTYKGQSYRYPSEIVHIQYDWKAHEHQLGIRFAQLTDETEAVMNLLIDPRYTIDLSAKQTIDTSAGKVSRDR